MATGPTPDYDRVLLKWHGVDDDGTPATGRLLLTYNGGVRLDDDPVHPTSIYPKTIVKDISTTVVNVIGDDGQAADQLVGYASFTVPVTDDPDIQGSGGTYRLEERLDNGRGRTINFEASRFAPDGVIYLNRLSAMDPIQGAPIPSISRAEFLELVGRVATVETEGGTGTGGGTATWPVEGTPSTFPPSSHTHFPEDVQGLDDSLSRKADLGLDGKLQPSQLPALALSEFLGVVSSQTSMLTLVGQRGDWCTRTDGTNAGEWVLIADSPNLIDSWRKLSGSPSSGVTSVNGQSGTVALTLDDIPNTPSRYWLTAEERQQVGSIVDVSRVTPGTPLRIIRNPAGPGWTYNGVVINARPGGRTDLSLDFIGGLETDYPSWGDQPGDTHEVTQTP